MISVVMCTYNTKEEYLRAAIESILNQTYADFEFIIVDDKSTQNDVDIIRSYRDSRIRLICNAENLKLTKSLNIGISHAKGQYIARMDADDIALPRRLAVQHAYMMQHPGKILCAALAVGFGDRRVNVHTYLTDDDEMNRIKLLYSTVISHPTVMIRKNVLDEHGITYDERYSKAQDYQLWITLSGIGSLGFVHQPLLLYRWHGRQSSSAQKGTQRSCSYYIAKDYWQRCGFDLDDDAFRIIHRFSKYGYDDAKVISSVLGNVVAQSGRSRIFDRRKFGRQLGYVYLKATAKYFRAARKIDFLLTRMFFWALNPLYYGFYVQSMRAEKRIRALRPEEFGGISGAKQNTDYRHRGVHRVPPGKTPAGDGS